MTMYMITSLRFEVLTLFVLSSVHQDMVCMVNQPVFLETYVKTDSYLSRIKGTEYKIDNNIDYTLLKMVLPSFMMLKFFG